MSDVQFSKAANLIRQEKYREARALLLTIDHPKSIEWLAQIDKIEAKRRKQRDLTIFVLVMLLFVGGIFVAVVVDEARHKGDAIMGTYEYRADTIRFCGDISRDTASLDRCLTDMFEPINLTDTAIAVSR